MTLGNCPLVEKPIRKKFSQKKNPSKKVLPLPLFSFFLFLFQHNFRIPWKKPPLEMETRNFKYAGMLAIMSIVLKQIDFNLILFHLEEGGG